MSDSQVCSTGQLPKLPGGALVIPGTVHESFVNTETRLFEGARGRPVIEFHGYASHSCDSRKCKKCGSLMHVKKSYNAKLRHVNIGQVLSYIVAPRNQLECPHCKALRNEVFPFEAKGHRITDSLENHIINLLEGRTMTLKNIAKITGVDRNIVKSIDKERLKKLYITDDGVYIIPDGPCPYLAVDEFSLHKGRRYATVVINQQTREVIYIAPTKNKQAIEEFMNMVGEEFMMQVKAVASDMNATFSETIKEKYPHIDIVYDRFHLVKNFNDIVINPVRISVQKKLIEEGRSKEAAQLKNSKYLMLSSKKKLEELDSSESKKSGIRTTIQIKLTQLFDKLLGKSKRKKRNDHVKRYKEIISLNELFLCCDLVKNFLEQAYDCTTTEKMRDCIKEIINICESTEDEHFIKFAKLLSNHLEGITNYAKHRITTGPLEGVNNKIKTLRRSAYGFRDDLYFFLLIMDACNPRVREKHGIIRPSQEPQESKENAA